MKKFFAKMLKPVVRWIAVNEPRRVPTDEKPTSVTKDAPASESDHRLTLTDWVAHFKVLLDPKNLVKEVTLLPEGMMTEAGVAKYEDPVLGTVENARIKGMTWLQGDSNGKLKPKNLGYNGSMREAWGTMTEAVKEVTRTRRDQEMRESLPVNPTFDLTDVGDWSQLTGNPGSITRNMPFPPGPFSKQMYLQDRWKMDSLAFQFYNYSGPARRVIDIKTDFILGNGVKVTFQDDDNLQAGWDEFEDRVGFHIIHRRWITSLRKYGNLFVQPMTEAYDKPPEVDEVKAKKKLKPGEQAPKKTEPVKMKLNVRSVDSSTIWDYVTNPEDIYEIYGYWVQFTTQYQLYTKGTKGPEQKYTEYIMRMMPPDSLIHVKVNCDENEKFGRSDLLPALPYFSYYDDYLRALVQRAIMEASYVWDVEVQTGDDTDVTREANKEGNFPKPGSSYFHNAAIKRNLIGFTGAAASGANQRGEEIITQISMATGVPKEFLGESGHSNKAAALTATAPFTKLVQAGQKEDEVMIRKLVKFYCEANGRPDAKFEVIYPEIAPADMLQKIQAMVLAEQSGYYSKERAATMVAKELNDTTYDYQDEKELIDQQKAEEQADMPMQTALYGAPHAPGQPGQPGKAPGQTAPPAPMPPKPPAIPGAGILPGGANAGPDKGMGMNGAKQQPQGSGLGN